MKCNIKKKVGLLSFFIYVLVSSGYFYSMNNSLEEFRLLRTSVTESKLWQAIASLDKKSIE